MSGVKSCVTAARCSSARMVHWKVKSQQQFDRMAETETQEQLEHVYQKPVRDVNELKQHLIELWSATSGASLINR